MKRCHNIMLRFNDKEYDKLITIAGSYNLDISERGVISPLLRRLVLDSEAEKKDKLPNSSNLAYHVNKIGNNINQLVKLAHHKNLRSPNNSLQNEMQKTNELLRALIDVTIGELTE